MILKSITYFLRSSNKTENSWDDVPDDIKNTFDRLGIPEAEQKWLGGVTAQYESEAVYHSIREDLEEQGVNLLGYGFWVEGVSGDHQKIFRNCHTLQ